MKRLVIWRDPDNVLREIALRPGLNFIWSPDPADGFGELEENAFLGHGSGKTLFCRLLRYCLGEDRFATERLQYLIAHAFPNGLVGIEVFVDSALWSIARPIGTGRKHFAYRDTALEKIVSGDLVSTGMKPFLEVMDNELISREVAALIPDNDLLKAWRVALAWLTRDQECRFDKVLDWRSSDSDSESPVRGWSVTKHLDALRALVGAIIPEEYDLRSEIDKLVGEENIASQRVNRLGWQIDRLREQLISELNVNLDEIPQGLLSVDSLRKMAEENLKRQKVAGLSVDATNLIALRSKYEKAKKLVTELETELARIQGEIPVMSELVRRIQGELGMASVHVSGASNPACPICEVTIDHALVEGCKLSHKLPNFNELQRRYAQLKEDLNKKKEQLQERQKEQSRITNELNPILKQEELLRQRLQLAEKERDNQSDAWYQTRRVFEDIDRLGDLLLEFERAQSNLTSIIGSIEERSKQVGNFRDSQAEVFGRLSQFFNAVVRELVGRKASGKVILDGNGLKLQVELGGERSTVAIDSLKVIAFDLAVMCMSIEGKVRLPAFFIHDSPREADLGLSVYYRLFNFVKSLEKEKGLFQYIITTTTRPPINLLKDPWLCLKIGGSAEDRLLKRDL